MADILIKNMEMPKFCYETDGQVVKPCDFLEVCRRKWGVNINALDIHSEACPLVALPEHGDLIDRGLVQEVLAQLLPLVITNELTDKEIRLVHRTVGAIAEMINEQEVVVEATE